MSNAPPGNKIIRGRPGYDEKTGKDRVTRRRDVRPRRFPPPLELGPNSAGWLAHEIHHRRGPCALLEMLTELGATWLLRTEIEQLVDHYARRDPVTPAAAGGGRVAAPLIHLISRLDVALGHLRDAEADVADPVVLHEL